MPEEIITPETEQTETPNSFNIDTPISSEDEEVSTRKRIIRRRLKPRKKAVEKTENVVAEPKIEKEEINTVLQNLYGQQEDDVQEIKRFESNGFLKASAFIIVAAFFALVLWAGFFLMPDKSKDQSQIALAINGPIELSIGSLSTYSISYANNSAFPIRNAVLNTNYPSGFVFSNSSPSSSNPGHNEWELGTIEPYQKGMISVSGYNFGSINDEKSWQVFLNYQPDNFNSRLQKMAIISTTIAHSPFKLTISGPDQVSVGSEAKYSFFLEKTGEWKSNVSIVPELPANFSIVSSSPILKRNEWKVVSSSEPTIYTLTGKFTGGEDKPSPMKGKVVHTLGGQTYEIASAQLTSVLLKNDVNIGLAINGNSVDFGSYPGDTLNMSIRVKNSSQNEIKGAVLKLSILAPAKDRQNNSLLWSEFVDKYDGTLVGEQMEKGIRRATVTWTSAQIPALNRLKPNDEIVLDLKLPVRDPKSFISSIGDQFMINALAEMSYKDAAKASQVISTKPINITLNSDLSFIASDDKSGSGVGETHDISWTLNNIFHPLKNITVTAQTFGDVAFDVRDKAAGEITYTDNHIKWTIPEMLEETDVLNSRFTITLNKFNPTQTLLLSKVTITAEDSVTGKTISLTGDEIPFKAE